MVYHQSAKYLKQNMVLLSWQYPTHFSVLWKKEASYCSPMIWNQNLYIYLDPKTNIWNQTTLTNNAFYLYLKQQLKNSSKYTQTNSNLFFDSPIAHAKAPSILCLQCINIVLKGLQSKTAFTRKYCWCSSLHNRIAPQLRCNFHSRVRVWPH
jgi:hypothetical protein